MERSEKISRKYRYYEILQVDIKAKPEEIKNAYLKLAKVYHPDINPDPGAAEKFKKINEAYSVLTNPVLRTSYDNSLAECPACWTHEVIQTVDNQWRCRHCACRFDASEVIIPPEPIKEKTHSEDELEEIKIFRTTQCSWCKKFYTHPLLCPFMRLQSNCLGYDKLSDSDKDALLKDERWRWRIVDYVKQVQLNGILARCRNGDCLAFNPNPQKTTCWKCGQDTLCCPKCSGKLYLNYVYARGIWKCRNAACAKEFVYSSKKRFYGTQEQCPNCGKFLVYDVESLLYRCQTCKRIYTDKDLHGGRGQTQGPDAEGKTPSPSPGTDNPPPPKKKSSNILTTIVVIAVLIVFGWITLSFLNNRGDSHNTPTAPVAPSVSVIPSTAPIDSAKLRFNRLNDPVFQFSIQYPDNWTYGDILNMANQEMQVKFFGKLTGTSVNNSDILVRYCPNNSYSEWFNTLSSGKSLNKLESKDRTQGDITYSSFVQSSNGELSRTFLANVKIGVLIIVDSCTEKGSTQYERDLLSTYSLIMMDSHRAVERPTSSTIANIPSPSQTISGSPSVTPSATPKPTSSPTVAEKPTVTSIVTTTTTRVTLNDRSYIAHHDGSPVLLTNYSNAKNPSWSQLLTFLKSDTTDKQKYVYPSFVCSNFAEILHNNAERAGWRCAFVSINLTGYPDFAKLGIPSNSGHALNAFETTDKGLVYIDCTGTISNQHPPDMDATVDVKVSKPYIPVLIFPSPGWQTSCSSMGSVTEIEKIQW